MTRPLRLKFAGALYRVTLRGDHSIGRIGSVLTFQHFPRTQENQQAEERKATENRVSSHIPTFSEDFLLGSENDKATPTEIRRCTLSRHFTG